MKEKLLATFMLFVLVITLCVGCSDGSSVDTSIPQTESEKTVDTISSEEADDKDNQYTIATVVKITGIAWYDRMEVGLEKFRQDTGVDAYITGHNTADPAEQARVIEDLIAQGVDALIVIPNSTEAVEPVLKKAREAGIVVIAHEATDIQNADYDLEAFDNVEYGEHLMENLGEFMSGEGKYTTFVGALTATSHNIWVESAVSLQEEQFPNMELVSNKNETQEDSEVAYTKTKELLMAYPDLLGFQGSAMADIPGVARAIEEAGKEEDTIVLGTCLVSTAEQFLESGAIDMISFWDPADAGYALNELALKVLQGEEIHDGMSLTPEGYQDLKLEGTVFNGKAWIDVTKDNMADYDF